MSVSVQDWIREVDALREEDDLLARGYWHAYRDLEGAQTPMRGQYYMVRWAKPTIAVSHDHRDEVLRLAREIERVVATADPEES